MSKPKRKRYFSNVGIHEITSEATNDPDLWNDVGLEREPGAETWREQETMLLNESRPISSETEYLDFSARSHSAEIEYNSMNLGEGGHNTLIMAGIDVDASFTGDDKFLIQGVTFNG